MCLDAEYCIRPASAAGLTNHLLPPVASPEGGCTQPDMAVLALRSLCCRGLSVFLTAESTVVLFPFAVQSLLWIQANSPSEPPLTFSVSSDHPRGGFRELCGHQPPGPPPPPPRCGGFRPLKGASPQSPQWSCGEAEALPVGRPAGRSGGSHKFFGPPRGLSCSRRAGVSAGPPR